MNKIEKWLDARRDVGLLALRLFVGLRLIYGVIDNVISWGRMEEFSRFLLANKFPFPMTSAILSVYVQFAGGLMILVGYGIRMASFLLVINFFVAVVMVHRHDTVEGMTPALAMFSGCITFLFCGAGKFALRR